MTYEQKQTIEKLNAFAYGRIVRACRIAKHNGADENQIYDAFAKARSEAVAYITKITQMLGIYRYWNAQQIDGVFRHVRRIVGNREFCYVKWYNADGTIFQTCTYNACCRNAR